MEISQLLEDHQLGHAAQGFADAGVTTFRALMGLTMQDYQSVGVVVMSDRRKLFEAIQKLKRDGSAAAAGDSGTSTGSAPALQRTSAPAAATPPTQQPRPSAGSHGNAGRSHDDELNLLARGPSGRLDGSTGSAEVVMLDDDDAPPTARQPAVGQQQARAQQPQQTQQAQHEQYFAQSNAQQRQAYQQQQQQAPPPQQPSRQQLPERRPNSITPPSQPTTPAGQASNSSFGAARRPAGSAGNRTQSPARGSASAGGAAAAGGRRKKRIIVAVRKRPLSQSEANDGLTDIVEADVQGATIAVMENKVRVDLTRCIEKHTFGYDVAFDERCNNRDVYNNTARALIDTVFEGGRATCFAYGQTGSGKTHTMEGTRSDPGIIPRAINRVFERIGELQQQQWEHGVTCTFVEIYNDCLRNLLEPSEAYHREFADPQTPQARLRSKHDIVHTKGKCDTTVTGVKPVVVRTPADIHKLLATASKNRSVAKTNMNARSSRSHCIFTMRIHSSNRALKTSFEGVLCLIDLAGSERVTESGAQGKEFKEAIAINRSLMHLGDCIAAMGTKNATVSWRNCNLTYLLQNFLGGDGAKMLMFVMVSDREEHASESANSLRFAAKVNNTVVGKATKRAVAPPPS
mmetsp:Transcript_37949/g.117277  ORF Transcript_37949/g.117277 Transcript_37949/m.117277 type:complete len:630 (-) Transcript_37949:23-1912(-)